LGSSPCRWFHRRRWRIESKIVEGQVRGKACVDAFELSDFPVRDQLPYPFDEGVVAEVHRFGDDEAGACRRVQHALGLGGVRGEGLFAEHVLACFDGVHAPVCMHADGQRHVHGIDAWVGQ
jgi:hypothetical protein